MCRNRSRLLLAIGAWLSCVAVGFCQQADDAPVKLEAAETAKQTDQEQSTTDAEDARADANDKQADDEKARPKRKYIRISRDENNKPLALETSVITFAPAGEKHQGVTIELVGAVHVGDAAYYAQLNKVFESYDVLLFELVAPEGTKIPKGGRKQTGSAVGALQGGMSSLLDLEHQLQQVDYTKKNFVHADMTPEEFAKSMNDRGESFFQMFLKSLGQSTAMQATGKQPISDTELLFALLSKDRSLRLKRLLARQFEDMESSMLIFDGPEGSTIITERNKKCFEVLKKQLENGNKRIGVFYGAGHLADMEQRLEKEFAMERTGEKWIVAWDLKSPAIPKASQGDDKSSDAAPTESEEDRSPFDEPEQRKKAS